MSSPSPVSPQLSPNDRITSTSSSPTKSLSSSPSSAKTTMAAAGPKPRTASASSKVRGAAAMWENKLADSTSSTPKSSTSISTSPKKLNIPGQSSAANRGVKGNNQAGANGSARTPSSPNKSTTLTTPKGGSSPRTLTPPSSFKTSDPKPTSRARSGSVSARSASPPAVRGSSPPPMPPMPSTTLGTSFEAETKSVSLETASSRSADDQNREDGTDDVEDLLEQLRSKMGMPEPIRSKDDTERDETKPTKSGHNSLEDTTLDDVDLDNMDLQDVQLDSVLDTKQLEDGKSKSQEATPLDHSTHEAHLDFSMPADKIDITSRNLPDPEPVITPANSSPTRSATDKALPSPPPHVPMSEASHNLDVADLPRRSTSRTRTPPPSGRGLAPHASEDASLPPPTTPAKTGFQSIFGRMMPATTPAKDNTEANISEPQATEGATPPGATSKSFFSSATSAFNSIQLPSVTLPSVSLPTTTPSRVNSQHTPPTDSPSTLQAPTSPPISASPGPSWRSTMSSFLHRGTSPQPSTPPPAPMPIRNGSSSGAALLLKRFESPTASRDRRISHEAGGSNQLREGFERVRNEMEGAARDMRRERAERGLSVEGDVDWTFWGAVVQDYEEVAQSRPKDLSRAIQRGIPAVIRGPIWQLMSSSKSSELEETYKALLKMTSPHEKAIQKDITRTFPNHKFFQGVGAGQDGLFMVVKAYSLYDQEVGYTQGVAFIVAALLLNMPDEEAFCVLVRLMDSYNLRSHYLADMPGLQLRLYQFDRLVEDILPLLHNHLVRKGIKSSMFASQWFMTLFSYRFPLSLVYRVMDIVLAEGIEAVFRFALALLQQSEDVLLGLEFEEILAHLTGDLYETYRVEDNDEEWRANDFVRDAYEIRITPLMLDQYESEWHEKCRAQSAHSRELEQLRNANRHLSQQVKSLEGSLATMNTEHVELVRQLVLAKIAKEDMETELVRYKSMCAQLAQAREEDVALPRNGSAVSISASLAGQVSKSREGSFVSARSDEGRT